MIPDIFFIPLSFSVLGAISSVNINFNGSANLGSFELPSIYKIFFFSDFTTS